VLWHPRWVPFSEREVDSLLRGVRDSLREHNVTDVLSDVDADPDLGRLSDAALLMLHLEVLRNHIFLSSSRRVSDVLPDLNEVISPEGDGRRIEAIQILPWDRSPLPGPTRWISARTCRISSRSWKSSGI
jgi:hypothetical protein